MYTVGGVRVDCLVRSVTWTNRYVGRCLPWHRAPELLVGVVIQPAVALPLYAQIYIACLAHQGFLDSFQGVVFVGNTWISLFEASGRS